MASRLSRGFMRARPCKQHELLCGLLCGASVVFLTPLTGLGEPLKELMESRSYQRIERPLRGSADLYSERWLTKGSSFASLFVEPRGGRFLLDWLGVAGTGLTLGGMEVSKATEFVSASRELLTPDFKKLTIEALVPHPKFKDTIEMGLIEKFVSLEPPRLKILFSKPVEFADAKGMLYEHEDGGCSIVVRSKRGAIVNLFTESCRQQDALLALAGKLDFARFAQRVES